MKGARGGRGTGGGTEAEDDKGQPQKAEKEGEREGGKRHSERVRRPSLKDNKLARR